VAIATCLTVVAVGSDRDAGKVGIERADATSARAATDVLFPIRSLTLASQALTTEIPKLAARAGFAARAARLGRGATHHRHTSNTGASHAATVASGSTGTVPAQSPPVATYASMSGAGASTSATASGGSSVHASQSTSGASHASQSSGVTRTVAQPAGPIGVGSAGVNCNPQCK
jgi:hypothetical protein